MCENINQAVKVVIYPWWHHQYDYKGPVGAICGRPGPPLYAVVVFITNGNPSPQVCPFEAVMAG